MGRHSISTAACLRVNLCILTSSSLFYNFINIGELSCESRLGDVQCSIVLLQGGVLAPLVLQSKFKLNLLVCVASTTSGFQCLLFKSVVVASSVTF